MNFLRLAFSIFARHKNESNVYKVYKIIVSTLLMLLLACIPTQEILSQSNSDSTLLAYFQKEELPITHANQVALLTRGEYKFEDLLEAIKQAHHHIHLEYFNFRNDSIANALFDLLAEKAAEGVEVRAMFDAFGNSSNNRPLKKKHLKEIHKRGIEIVKFDPIRFPWINHAWSRDHRKIVVIDGIVGYTGGMNIADYYIHGLPKVGEWRDIHIRIEGNAVRYLQSIFLDMWNKETGQHIGGPKYFPNYHEPLDAIAEPIVIVDRKPNETPSSIRDAYSKAIESAEKKVQIINPYFVPTKGIRKSIKKALKKGTEVEIMIPAVSDIAFTPDASYYIGHKLMKKGAKVYLFNGGFHHSKVMMIDSTHCTVGTANLNSRSLRYDYETNAFIFHPHTTNQLIDLFEEDKLNSTQITPELWKERSAWKKFVGWVGNLLTPFL